MLYEPCLMWRGFFILPKGRFRVSKMGETRIKIVLNGKEREISSGTTISGLLRDLSVPETRVAIERNTEIIRKASFDTLELVSGDRLEIVTLVGGG